MLPALCIPREWGHLPGAHSAPDAPRLQLGVGVLHHMLPLEHLQQVDKVRHAHVVVRVKADDLIDRLGDGLEAEQGPWCRELALGRVHRWQTIGRRESVSC